MKHKSLSCPLCDSHAIETRFDLSKKYKYLGVTHVLDGLEHSVCTECGCDFFAEGQIERNNSRFFELEKRVVKAISPREIRQIREEYLLSQEDAEKAFNCGAGMFSKWERGTSAPTGTAALTLIRALEDVAFMKWLADRAGITIHANDTETNEAAMEDDCPVEVIESAFEAKLSPPPETTNDFVNFVIYPDLNSAEPKKTHGKKLVISSPLSYWLQFHMGAHDTFTIPCDNGDEITEKLVSDAYFANYASHR